jgi:hypothetical protein
LFLDVILASPELFAAVGVPRGRERSHIFRQWELVFDADHFARPYKGGSLAFKITFLFVLEPGVGNTEIKLACDLDHGVCPEEDFPVVVDTLLDWREPDIQQREVLEGLAVP